MEIARAHDGVAFDATDDGHVEHRANGRAGAPACAVPAHFPRVPRERRDAESGQVSLFDGESLPGVDEDFGITIEAPMSSEDRLRLEKEMLGRYFSDHPRKRNAGPLAKLNEAQALEIPSKTQGQGVRVGGRRRRATGRSSWRRRC